MTTIFFWHHSVLCMSAGKLILNNSHGITVNGQRLHMTKWRSPISFFLWFIHLIFVVYSSHLPSFFLSSVPFIILSFLCYCKEKLGTHPLKILLLFLFFLLIFFPCHQIPSFHFSPWLSISLISKNLSNIHHLEKPYPSIW